MRVYVIQNRDTLVIHGCFKTKAAAEKYANNRPTLAVLSLRVHE